MIDTREYISNLDMPEKVTLFKELYNELAGYGIDGDTELAHVNTFEASLLKSLGGSGTINDVTGLKEYKGGGGSAPPPPPPTTSQTVTQTSEFPTEIKPFIKDVLGEAKTEFGREQEEGYLRFPGAQLAQFTPEQEAAFAAGRQQFTGLAGTPLAQASTYYQPALAATALGTSEIGAEDIQRRMDPFLQNVVDIAKREARSDEDIARQQRAAQAVAGQGFLGGTRPAFVEAQAGQDLAERLGDIQARGLSVAFQNAQREAEQQRQREMTGGRQFAALGDVTGTRARGDIAGLAGIGETQQQRSQQALDIGRREFEEEKAFPQTALQRYASIIRGFPLTPSQTTLATRREAPPSLAQSLTAAGLGAAGIYGMFGGFNPSKPTGAATGGLVSLQGGGQPAMNINMGTGGGYSPSLPTIPSVQGGLDMDILMEELARRGMNRSNGGLMSVIRRDNGGAISHPESLYGIDKEGLEILYPNKVGTYDPIPVPTFLPNEPAPATLDEFYNLREQTQTLKDALRDQAVKRQEVSDLYGELPSEAERKAESEKFFTDRRARLAERTGTGKGQALLAAAAAVAGADPSKGYLASLGAGAQEGLGAYGPIAERAYQAEDELALAERGELKSLPLEIIQQRIAQLKLDSGEVTDQQMLFNMEKDIKALEIEKSRYDAEWYAAHGPKSAVMPAISDVANDLLSHLYGDIKSPGNNKAAAAAARLAWRSVWADANKDFAESGVAFPGPEELNARILDHLAMQESSKWQEAYRLSGTAPTGTTEGNEGGDATASDKLSEADKRLKDAEALGTVLGGG